MTILFVSIEFNYCCGISRAVFALSKELKKNGHRVILACPNGTMVSDFVSNGFDQVYLPVYPYNKKIADAWHCVRTIKKIIKKEKVDIVHSHNRLAELYTVVATTFTRVPTVSSAHSLISGKKFLSFRSDRIIAISKVVKTMLIADFKIDGGKISLIRNIPRKLTKPLSNDIENFRKQLGLSDKDFVMAGIGRLHPEKGFDVFLEGLKKLSHIKNIKAVLVGKGEMDEQLKSYAQTNDINVIFVDEMSEVELIYEAADLIVVPSRQESAGLVAVEAGFFQKAVIATNVGGLPETIKDGTTGLLIKPDDGTALACAVERLYADKNFSKLLGRQLYDQIINEYSGNIIIQKIEIVYNHLIAGDGRSKNA
jgi:glycosyltransferase involved in cell wall biosynthesis